MKRDPVFGMQVSDNHVAGSSEYKGITYYFCSPRCKETFENNPGKYVGKGISRSGHSH